MRYLLEKIAATHCRLARLVADPGSVRRIVATGGGARSPIWLQIKADMLGIPIVKSSSSERACLGAAAIAAAAAGTYPTVTEATFAMVHPGDAFEPNPAAAAIYRGLAGQ
jgi:xylulokinase